MFKFPDDIQKILDAVQHAAYRTQSNVYTYGNFVKYIITKNSNLLYEPISFIISNNDKFDIDSFYVGLIKNITVNQELEKTLYKYRVISSPYELSFESKNNFSIDNWPAFLSIDYIFYNVNDKQIVDPTGYGINDLQSDPINLRIIKDYNLLECQNIIDIYKKTGLFDNTKIDNISLARLNNINISKLNKYNTYKNVFIPEVLNSLYPGNILKFICNTFQEGKSWLFKSILDFVLSKNIPINEDVHVDNVLNNKKFELINIYNEFLLSDRVGVESKEHKIKRINTTLKLLFDSTKLTLKKSYIDDPTIFRGIELFGHDVGGPVSGSTVESFASDLPPIPPPYDPLPSDCVPDNCSTDSSGNQCCCCSVISYLEQINTECHTKVDLSCNSDGTGPIDGSVFNPNCTYCTQACDMVLAGNCSNLINQSWWPNSSKTSICNCSCHTSSNGTCKLWCVECGGKCKSKVDYQINTSDCLYNLILSPSEMCCGSIGTIQVMFVMDISGSMWSVPNTVLQNIDTLVDNLSQTWSSIEFSLFSYGRGNAVTDVGSAFLGKYTEELSFTTNIPALKNVLINLDGLINNPGNQADTWQWNADLDTIEHSIQSFDQNKNKLIIILGDNCSQLGIDSGGQTWIDNQPSKTINCSIPPSGYISAVDNLYDHVLSSLLFNGIPVVSISDNSIHRFNLSNSTGGQHYILEGGNLIPSVFQNLDIGRFPADCSCLDSQDILVSGLPIKKCTQGQVDSGECNCGTDSSFFISECGITINVSADETRMLCCSEIGCECSKITSIAPDKCCGPQSDCTPVCVNNIKQYTSLRSAIDAVWCDCFSKGIATCDHCCCPDGTSDLNPDQRPCQQLIDEGITAIPNVNCCPCSNVDSCCNCQVSIDDGSGGFNIFDRPDIVQQVKNEWEICGEIPIPPPIPPEPPDAEIPDDVLFCTGECKVCRNPSTVILNNGIGLIAYEDHDSKDISIIKIKQFKTSVKHKLLPNRKFNFGRLENKSKWTTSAKLYYYNDDPATHWIDSNDHIGFKSGPLKNQFFQLSSSPLGSDSTGEYISFQATSETSLTENFTFTEDVYNVEWYLVDSQDSGFIGDATDTSTEGKQYIVNSSTDIDIFLDLPRHMYNGEYVPISNPSISTAYNYSDQENAHHIYLTYQALEDNQWNIYLRSIRLSEYDTDISKMFNALNLISFDSISSDVGYVIGKVVNVTDAYNTPGHWGSLVQEPYRSVIFEFYLPDGRPILNCGEPSGNFQPYLSFSTDGKSISLPKNRIHYQLVHFVPLARCHSSNVECSENKFVSSTYNFDKLFKDFRVGQEYTFSNTDIDWLKLSNHGTGIDNPTYALTNLQTPKELSGFDEFYSDFNEKGNCYDDNVGSGSECNSDQGFIRNGFNVYGWEVESRWYQYWNSNDPSPTNTVNNALDTSMWCVVDKSQWSIFSKYKGTIVSNPIKISIPQPVISQTDGTLITENLGHCTHPDISVNSNNDVYIVYECSNNNVHQIRISGTAIPGSSLPLGVLNPENPDNLIGTSLSPNNFNYHQTITSNGMNQLPSIDIDYNDVVHVAWQSNRDHRWEIYYANSNTKTLFKNKRITNHQGNSLKPNITNESSGRSYISWHDNRFNHYEIMMAYLNDTRIIPLSQQNAYMSGYRNDIPHYMNFVPLLLENSSSVTRCFNDIIVSFYTNKELQGDPDFTISRLEHPYAFLSRYKSPHISDSNQLCLYADEKTEELVLISAPDSVSSRFGESVSTNGSYIVIGDPQNSTQNNDSGAFHIYNGDAESSGFGSFIKTIYNPNGGTGDQFGYSVDIDDNNIIIVSAPWTVLGNDPYQIGNVYLYTINGNLLTTLQDPDPDSDFAIGTVPQKTEGIKDRFGWNVKLNNDKAIISAPWRDVDSFSDAGSVYVYNVDQNDTAFGELEYRITSPSPYDNEKFGYDFDIYDNQTIIIGTQDNPTSSGSIHLLYWFDLNSGSLNQTTTGGSSVSSGEGGSISVKAGINNVLIGNINWNQSKGRVHVIETGSGIVEQTFGNPDTTTGSIGDEFGFGLTYWNEKVAISSPMDSSVNPQNNSGTVYVFSQDLSVSVNSTYTQRIVSPSPANNGNFGYAMDSAGDYMLISAPGENSGKGNVYIYSPRIVLDLTPSFKSIGGQTQINSTPLPENFVPNQTYFIKVSAIDDASLSVSMPDQNRSVSCLNCVSSNDTWNALACTYQVDVENTSNETRYYDIKIKFYGDKEKNHLIYEYDTFTNLNFFTVDGGIEATTEWGNRGLKVSPKQTRSVFAYPDLSKNSGLVCGVVYYLEIHVCFVAESDTTSRCTSIQIEDNNDSNVVVGNNLWVCNCDALRWEDLHGDSPENIEKIKRWNSSADSKSDVRITETDYNINNLNSNINIRTNSSGVITYESNREGSNRDIYKAYSSVFAFFPAPLMYSSGSENIKKLGEDIVRTDIPITKFDSADTLEIRNINTSIDQYDNLFMSGEKFQDDANTVEFKKNKNRTVLAHSGGADPQKLFTSEIEEGTSATTECDPSSIINATFRESNDSSVDMNIFNNIIRKFRVNNDYVKYHINRNGKLLPVIDKCDIYFDIVGTSGSVAFRLKNGSEEWSSWMPFDPKSGENSISVSWKLAPVSGIKTVTMQVATYAGLSLYSFIDIVADYTKVKFDVKFYRSSSDSSDISDDSNFTENNIISTYEGIPVASIRPVEIKNKELVSLDNDFIFIEIIPEKSYLHQFENLTDDEKSDLTNGISPVFDFIHQGLDDIFDLPTVYSRDSSNREVFRGVINIHEENKGSYIDGLSLIVPHFKSDCSSGEYHPSFDSSGYNKDKYNILSLSKEEQSTETSKTMTDPWSSERDARGLIKHALVSRPSSDDPYLIFGDPDYRLKKK